MNRQGFCKGCQSCVTPCRLNKPIGKSLEQMIEEFLVENLDLIDELYEQEKSDDENNS